MSRQKMLKLTKLSFQLQIYLNKNQIIFKSVSTNLETQNMISNHHSFWATIKTNFFPTFQREIKKKFLKKAISLIYFTNQLIKRNILH